MGTLPAGIDDAALTGMQLIQKLPGLMKSSDQSLIEYTKATRVEPIVLIDQRAMNLPYAGDIMQSLSSIFSGYYLQAVAISMNVGNVETLKMLDSVNPRRDPKENMGRFFGEMVSEESYQYALPRPEENVGLEAYGIEASSSKYSVNKDIQEPGDLSVGKMLEVEVQDGDKKATFPITMRLIVSGTTPEMLVHTLAIGNKNDTNAKERFHAWRAGQLEFIRDLVMCQDLIDAHKDNLLKDKSGFYAKTLQRRKGNKLSAIFSNKPSVATASNIYVITDQTRKQLEGEMRGKLKDFKTRERMFKETYGMLLVVVDTEWEQVTIYHRGIDTPTELSIKDMQRANSRGGGPDIMEILKAYQLGQSPSI